MPDVLAAEAFAKVNLGLVVGSRAADGYHPITSLAQSVSWSDHLELHVAEDDDFTAEGMAASESNLAWRAVMAVRALAGSNRPLSLQLSKRIPVAAGLAGGSADAAAGLGLTAALLGLRADLTAAAAELGADVPFCLSGGLAIMEGRGERLTAQRARGGYALGLVVPPVELPTPVVYERWDAMDEPVGPTMPDGALPPTLRDYAPLRNDLQPAAEAIAPEIADWRADLQRHWGRPVMMTGSGPTLFGFFLDEDEAVSAITGRSDEARAARAAVPVSQGWRRVPGTLTAPE
jgi:4-diphosphocytidyl-2-C-methyl-D-erythritol kinase